MKNSLKNITKKQLLSLEVKLILFALLMVFMFNERVMAQDTTRLTVNKNVALTNLKGIYSPNLILGKDHQFRGKISFNKDSSRLFCKSCVYFFQTGDIAIELAKVDLEMETKSTTAHIFYRTSYTETFIVPDKLKIQIIEMDFDILSPQPALMNPLVTDDFMVFERSQLIYFNTENDSTSWLANKIKIDLRSGDIACEGLEVFNPYGCSITPFDNRLVISKKGNIKPFKKAKMRFQKIGEIQEVEDVNVHFIRQTTFFEAKGVMYKDNKTYRIKKIGVKKLAGVYEIDAVVKKK